MSDRMHPIPFAKLMEQLLEEYDREGTLFGVRSIYRHQSGKRLEIFGEKPETPFGPAAGPHTQLAQNIIAAYAGGARFFELKTVQKLDGEDLPVSKPCILAQAEGYNVEWSTELTVAQAFDEYVKAWLALKLISVAFGLGARDGFVFNMSVGYDLAGIRTEKLDRFIEGLKEARETPVWNECVEWTKANLSRFDGLTAEEVDAFDSRVCKSITLSTLHGCPPDEIERIATYLIKDKHLNTFVKCNPTLLGYEFARRTMDRLGYEEMVFDDHHFKADLQLSDAVPMFLRLGLLADGQGVSFGLKLSNTFPVGIARHELPGEEMYMSGKALWPLTIHLVQMIEHAFEGKIRVSYSGGADEKNIGDLFDAGVWPITMATTLLKQGGYNRLQPIAELLSEREYRAFDGVDLDRIDVLAAQSLTDPRYQRPLKPSLPMKNDRAVPLMDCFLSPCSDGCPIHQDIPAYMELVSQGQYAEALAVICEKNPLPFITGTICTHRCMSHCVRNQYDDPLQIRAVKLLAAQRGFDAFVETLAPKKERPERVAVIGGGPAGMALAYFLAREGAKATIFEQRNALGGVVRHAIPAFRIANDTIENDAEMLRKLGVTVKLNTPADSAQTLLENGFTHVAVCCGAWAHGSLGIDGEINVLDFLEKAKKAPDLVTLGKHVIVVGAGNTAMDAARMAKRLAGVEDVTIVYRRTVRQMPADAEELTLAQAEEVCFRELLSPVSLADGVLTCDVMRLGEPDESGRRSPEKTGDTVELPCDSLIASIGEKVDVGLLTANDVKVTTKGRPSERKQNDRVYVLGDALRGPATVVEAIADALETAKDILGVEPKNVACQTSEQELLKRHAGLKDALCPEEEFTRCLGCGKVCLECVDTCPNRANVAVTVDGRQQVVHLDGRCNECGNCAVFCPYKSAPYRDKWTYFEDEAAFHKSENQGFALLENGNAVIRFNKVEFTAPIDDPSIPQEIAALLRETAARVR